MKLFKPPSIKHINSMPKVYTAASFFAGCGGASIGYKLAGFEVLYANEFVPIAADTYKANAGTTRVDTRDIRLIKGPQLLKHLGLKRGELDLLDGSPPCFPAGIMITTDRGIVPIEQVVVGDRVLTHEGRYRRVNKTMSHVYKGKMYHIKAASSAPISATAEHPFYTRRNTGGVWDISAKLANPTWVGASELNTKDFVAQSIDQSSQPYAWKGCMSRPVYHRVTKELLSYEITNTLKVTNLDFWWVAGRYVADGWLRYSNSKLQPGVKAKRSRSSVYIAVTKVDGGVRLREVLKRLNSAGFNASYSEQLTAHRVGFNSREMCEFLAQFGRGAKIKRVPGFVQRLPVPMLQSFLEGYLSGDGHEVPNGFKYASVSKELIFGMAEVIRKVYRIPVGLSKRTPQPTTIIQGRTVNQSPSYMGLAICAQDADKYMRVNTNKHIWVPIRKIETTLVRQRVYNLEVEQDESYVANGYVVHNCSSFSLVGTRDKQWGQVKDYSEGIKQRTDDLFDEHLRMVEAFYPKVLVCENVPGLAMAKARGYFLDIIDRLRSLGYTVGARVVDAANLGLPQHRRRLIIIGIRNDVYKKAKLKEVPFPKPSNRLYTVQDVLPHITHIRVARDAANTRFEPADRPSPTIVASDGTNSMSGRFSCGAFVDTKDGERRKYTISEMKVLFGFPKDFKLLGNYAQQVERLGRTHTPCSTYHISKVLVDQVLGKI